MSTINSGHYPALSCRGRAVRPDGYVCPPVVAYDQAVRERAAAEIEALPQDSAVAAMMADYHVLRQQALACR